MASNPLISKCSFDEPQVKRLSKRHDPIRCEIELNGGRIKRDTIAKMVCEMCRYLMFEREQVPIPMAACHTIGPQYNQWTQKQKDMILKTFEKLNSLFDLLVGCIEVHMISIDCVLLSLGNQLNLPKELYCIQFPPQHIYSIEHNDDCKQLTLRSAVTRFFNSIVSDSRVLAHQKKHLGVTKISLLIRIKRNDAQKLIQDSNKCESDECNQLSFTPRMEYEMPKVGTRFHFIISQSQCECQQILNGNNNKKPFKIYEDKSRESMETHVEDTLCESMSQVMNVHESSDDQLTDTNNEFIWVQIGSTVGGLKL